MLGLDLPFPCPLQKLFTSLHLKSNRIFYRVLIFTKSLTDGKSPGRISLPGLVYVLHFSLYFTAFSLIHLEKGLFPGQGPLDIGHALEEHILDRHLGIVGRVRGHDHVWQVDQLRVLVRKGTHILKLAAEDFFFPFQNVQGGPADFMLLQGHDQGRGIDQFAS